MRDLQHRLDDDMNRANEYLTAKLDAAGMAEKKQAAGTAEESRLAVQPDYAAGTAEGSENHVYGESVFGLGGGPQQREELQHPRYAGIAYVSGKVRPLKVDSREDSAKWPHRL